MESTAAGLGELLANWNGCHGAFYQAELSDLHWNLREQSWVEYRGEEAGGVRMALAVATPEGLRAGISGRTLWICFHSPVAGGVVPALVRGLEDMARGLGKTRISFGGDEFHFFSGVPVGEEAGAVLSKELVAHGFQVSEAGDFTGEMTTPAIAAYVQAADALAQRERFLLLDAEDASDLDRLGEFLRREFPGRWEREFRFWRQRVDTGRATWQLMIDDKNEILGFSRVAVRGRLKPLDQGWNPGALRLPLGGGPRDITDCCLGPIGVAASGRGKGWGKILLGLSLQKLLRNNARRICIDWTNAYNYYTPLGVQLSRKFHGMWKDI